MTNEIIKTIKSSLSGDTQKNALDFTTFLESNNFTINGAEVSYNGNVICYMHLDDGDNYPSPWTIWTEGDYSKENKNVPIDDNIKDIAWEHINYCGACGGVCNPGTQKIIFGKTFDNVCSADMAFYKPDSEALECLKKLLLMRKEDII